MNWLEDLNTLKLPPLSTGSHASPEQGLCAMEMVAYIERLEHSDTPACTCPIIAAYVRTLNDRMPDDQRQRLMAYLPRLVGTVSPQHEQARAKSFAWASIKQFAAVALRSAGIEGHAAVLESQKNLKAAARAAYAADAAADAAAADAYLDIWDLALQALDDALAIGPQGNWTNYDSAHVKTLEALA